MRVVDVRCVRVAVTCRTMLMPMAVRAGRHGVMDVIVMTIVVPMCMFMLHLHVFMLVGVLFGQMQEHSRQHQDATQRQAPAC